MELQASGIQPLNSLRACVGNEDLPSPPRLQDFIYCRRIVKGGCAKEGDLRMPFATIKQRSRGFLSEPKFKTEFAFFSSEKRPEFRRKRGFHEPLLTAMAQALLFLTEFTLVFNQGFFRHFHAFSCTTFMNNARTMPEFQDFFKCPLLPPFAIL